MEMNRWTPEIVHFMEDASVHTGYFRALGDIVKQQVPEGGRLCDAGCGLGQLAIELSPWAERIDAVDYSINAISYLAGRVALLGVTNVAPVFNNIHRAVAHDPYDYMMFVLSLGVEEAYAAAAELGVERFLVINKVHRLMEADRARAGSDRLGAPTDKRPIVYDFATTIAELNAEGYACSGYELDLEFGQPFRSLAEAQLYFRLFRTRSYPQGITIEELQDVLEPGSNDRFPWYLPVTRHLAIFLCER
jgi:SAM-dependent methyltransferase